MSRRDTSVTRFVKIVNTPAKDRFASMLTDSFVEIEQKRRSSKTAKNAARRKRKKLEGRK